MRSWGRGAGHARAGVGMTGKGDVEVEYSGRNFGAGGARPWVGIYPSTGDDIESTVVIYSGIEVEA